MTVPACLNAGILAGGGGHLSVSITTPLNGSTIPNNTTAESITGIAQSTAGNVTTLQYSIDGGAYTNFTFTPSGRVSYSGGNAGEIGGGTHTISVKAIDAAANTVTTTSTYTITAAPPPTSYSWAPTNVYTGQNSYLSVVSAASNAAVAFTGTVYDAHGSVLQNIGMTSLGSTNAAGNFSYTSVASWGVNDWSEEVQLYVGGTNVASFNFQNFSSGAVTYSPSVAPNGTTITLSISGSYANSVVSQTTVYEPGNVTVGPTALGSTNGIGDFSYNGTTSWASYTSATITVYLNGISQGSFGFTP